jgi:hypothetical protein
MKPIDFERDIQFEDDIICCPCCGDEYLHQFKVEVGWRQEDADVRRHISTFSGVQMDVFPAQGVASPNGYGYRRSYVIITFDCENCSAISEMEIRQHKGNTHVSWVKAYEKEQYEKERYELLS